MASAFVFRRLELNAPNLRLDAFAKISFMFAWSVTRRRFSLCLSALHAGVSCRSVIARSLRLLFIRTSAIVKSVDVLTVELGLLQSPVDDVMNETAPHCCCCSRRYLRGILGEDLSEVFGTLSAADVVSSRNTSAAAQGGVNIPRV